MLGAGGSRPGDGATVMMTAGNFLRSLRGQLVSALLALLVILLGLFAAFWAAEHRSHESVERLSGQALEELARGDLARRGRALAEHLEAALTEPVADA